MAQATVKKSRQNYKHCQPLLVLETHDQTRPDQGFSSLAPGGGKMTEGKNKVGKTLGERRGEVVNIEPLCNVHLPYL